MISTTSPHRILVTGSAGRLGRAAVSALRDAGHFVRGYDRSPTPRASEHIVGSLLDTAQLDAAFDGISSVVHLAAAPDDSDVPGFVENTLVPTNVTGAYHLLEAARRHGIKRIVLASTGQLNWTQQYEGRIPIRAHDPVTPRHWYAATKMFLESVGYSYATQQKAEVIAVRLGWCPRRGQAQEIAVNQTAQDLYLSPKDAGRFFERAATVPVPPGFHILYAASLPLRAPIFDMEPAMQMLGWKPTEQWPTGAEDDLPPL